MKKITLADIKKEAVKNIEEKRDLYYDVLVDMSSSSVKEEEILKQVVQRLINTHEKYRHLIK